MTITFNRWLAIVGGILVPLTEILRRYHQLLDPKILPFWMDDFVLGGLLLYGAWRTRHDVVHGLPSLTAGWGFACGMGYASFFGQLMDLQARPVDVSGASAALVVTIKGIALAFGVIGLITALMWKPAQASTPAPAPSPARTA
jgi:hypothetical protein